MELVATVENAVGEIGCARHQRSIPRERAANRGLPARSLTLSMTSEVVSGDYERWWSMGPDGPRPDAIDFEGWLFGQGCSDK
jgi:hypothetical protein